MQNNTAGFGGGLFLGSKTSSQRATCAVALRDAAFVGNVALHGGGQVYSMCTGDFVTVNTSFVMSAGVSQVWWSVHGVSMLCVLLWLAS